MPPPPSSSSWPNHAPLAISLTIDNMGEAADLDRNLWPGPSSSESPIIAQHFSVIQVLPQFLDILGKYGISATYFIEAWNLDVYGKVIWEDVLGGEEERGKGGHEVGWHAWRHEAWVQYREDEKGERENVERSFEGLGRWMEGNNGNGNGNGNGSSMGEEERRRKKVIFKGFRPPGGILHGERSLKLLREFGIDYVSPAGRDAAVVKVGGGGGDDKKNLKEDGKEEEKEKEKKEDSIVILPFRWSTVDAYYYMETFSKLRTIKGELPEQVQSEETLKKFYIAQIDRAIAEGQAQQQGEGEEKGGAKYLSFLFHPFLNNSPERLQVFEDVVKYLAEKRDQGQVWLARCCDVTEWIRQHPGMVGADPGWDETVWR